MKDYRVLFAGIIICSSLITGCAASARETDDTSDAAFLASPTEDTADMNLELTAATEQETIPEITTGPAEPTVSPDISEQLNIILENYDAWVPKIEYPEDYDPAFVCVTYNCDAYYAVTDLDGDGQLEITVSEYDRGSGVFSRFLVYEVTGEGDLLLLNGEPDPAFDMPDLFEMNAVSFYTDEDGVRWNLASDYEANGRYGHRYVYQRISTSDGLVIENLCEKVYHGESEGDYYSYYDGEGNEITGEEFDQLYESEYASAAEGENALGWIRGSGNGDLLIPDIDMLTESYLAFSGS